MKHVAPPSELEPLRLIAGGGTARERRLLEAAASDVMPAGTPERLEQALAAWAALPAGQGSEPARAARGSRLSRWGIVGGLGGLAVLGWMLGRGRDESAREPSIPTASAPLMPLTPAAVALATATEPVAPAVPAGEPAPLVTSRGVARVHEATPRTRAGASQGRADSRGNLLEEARRLDRVRSALDAHDGSAARRELSDYRARFPRGELALEADVLEADVLLFSGEPERARTLASALLERPEAGRYRQRLEQFLQRARGAQGAPPQLSSATVGSKRKPIHMDERR